MLRASLCGTNLEEHNLVQAPSRSGVQCSQKASSAGRCGGCQVGAAYEAELHEGPKPNYIADFHRQNIRKVSRLPPSGSGLPRDANTDFFDMPPSPHKHENRASNVIGTFPWANANSIRGSFRMLALHVWCGSTKIIHLFEYALHEHIRWLMHIVFSMLTSFCASRAVQHH